MECVLPSAWSTPRGFQVYVGITRTALAAARWRADAMAQVQQCVQASSIMSPGCATDSPEQPSAFDHWRGVIWAWRNYHVDCLAAATTRGQPGLTHMNNDLKHSKQSIKPSFSNKMKLHLTSITPCLINVPATFGDCRFSPPPIATARRTTGHPRQRQRSRSPANSAPGISLPS